MKDTTRAWLEGFSIGLVVMSLLLAAIDAFAAAQERTMAIRIIFDGPPGPDAGQFVEVETDTGESISIGEWIDRKDGYWALRIAKLPAPPEQEDTDDH